VEITDFCEQAIKQRESEAHGVVKLAGKVYSESGEPFLDVGVMWAPHFKITKPRSEKLAKNLAAVVRMKTPELGMRRTLDWRDFDPELVEAIAHVSIDHTIASTQHSWNCVGGGPIPPWNIEELQARIDAKNNKPAKYPVHYREKWLLIVSAFGAPFGWRKMTPEIEAHAFRSAFDRIVLLSSFPSEVFNLLVNRVCAQPFPAAIPSQSSRTAAR
jgi:hypothetical protein